MNVASIAIKGFANYMLGGDNFDKIKDIIRIYSSKELSGSEKRTQAFADIKDLGLGLAEFLINLGIELAVVYLNSLKK